MELQVFCWGNSTAMWGKSSFVGIYWDREALPVTDTQGMPHFEHLRAEINPNTHNISGQPQCKAPPRWTRRWSNKWGLCPAGKRGFPAPGAELPGSAHSSLCSSFLHRKPWLCSLLLRWDTGRGERRAKGNVRNWNCQDINPALLGTILNTLRWGVIQKQQGEKGKKKKCQWLFWFWEIIPRFPRFLGNHSQISGKPFPDFLEIIFQIIPFSSAFLKGFSPHCKT